MSLATLQLRHGCRIPGADPGREAVDGSNPVVSMPSAGIAAGGDVHTQLRRLRVAPGPAIPAREGGSTAASRRRRQPVQIPGASVADNRALLGWEGGSTPAGGTGGVPSRTPGGPAPQRWQRRPRRPPVTPRNHAPTRRPRSVVIGGRRGNLRRLARPTGSGRTTWPRTLPKRRVFRVIPQLVSGIPLYRGLTCVASFQVSVLTVEMPERLRRSENDLK